MTVKKGRPLFEAFLPQNFRFATQNLDLVPSTEGISHLDWSDHANLSRLLSAVIPAEWPPRLVEDSSSPNGEGWWDWYVVKRDGNTVIGMIGLKGWPAVTTTIQMGCSFLPRFQRQSYGTEAVEGITRWVLSQPGITSITAETPIGNDGAIKVLCKLGYSPTESTDPEFLRFAKPRPDV